MWSVEGEIELVLGWYLDEKGGNRAGIGVISGFKFQYEVQLCRAGRLRVYLEKLHYEFPGKIPIFFQCLSELPASDTVSNVHDSALLMDSLVVIILITLCFKFPTPENHQLRPFFSF